MLTDPIVIVQVAFYGIALLWLGGLVPAAIVTCLKEQWLLFALGWITGGILWFVGAASLAPPGSLWARRLYGPEKLARAVDPLRHRRDWRRMAVAASAAAMLALAAGLFGARPAPVLGLSGRPLQSSVGNGVVFGGSPCTALRDGAWLCDRWDDQGSGTVAYRVRVNGLGCWHATRSGPSGEGSPRRVSGCVTLLDYL